MDDIQKLNPEFRRWTTPVKKGEYTIKVPRGHRRAREAGLEASAPGQLNAMQLHTREARRNAGHHRQETAGQPDRPCRRRTTCASTRASRSAIALVIPRMPSASLLARASAAPTDADKTAEAIAAGSAHGNLGGSRRAGRGADLSRALRRYALRHRQTHRHYRQSVEALEQAARRPT